MTLVRIERLFKSFYDENLETEIKALEDITLSIERNDFFTIIGPSGCGKSTLLNIIAGLERPTSCQAVTIAGKPVTGPDPKRIALMFQDPVLYPWRTVIKNVEFGLEAQHLPREERRQRALKYIRLVGLEEWQDAYPRQLSGGMKQRVALCRALAMETEILLMDEPFGALDEQTRIILGDELVDIWSKVNKTVIFVTHSLSEAVYLAERIVIMTARPGRVKRILPVTCPRPRQVSSPEFVQTIDAIWQELREESLKAIGRGRK